MLYGSEIFGFEYYEYKLKQKLHLIKVYRPAIEQRYSVKRGKIYIFKVLLNKLIMKTIPNKLSLAFLEKN